jgi:hypothetical protein
VTDEEWLELLAATQPDAERVAALRLTRTHLMDRITAIDDLIAELE